MNYPPNMDEARKLFRELKSLDNEFPGSYNARKYEIIHDLAEGKFLEAKEYFVKGLVSDDPDYRWSCISALVTHWRDEDPRTIQALINGSEHDMDPMVRDISISSLGVLKVKDSLPLLKQIILDENVDWNLRKSAYVSVLRIKNQPEELIHELIVAEQFDEDTIDQELLNSI